MPIEDPTTKIPSVTFHMEGCEEGGLLTGKLQLSMRLVATIESREMLEKIKKKFEGGLEVHTIDDFKNHMIKALKSDNVSHEQRIRDLEVQLLNERKEKLALKEELQNAKQGVFNRT